VLVSKSRRIEVRQLRSSAAATDASAAAAAAATANSMVQSPFPVVLTVPLNGKLTSLCPFKTAHSPTSYVFFTTDQFRYAVISYEDPAGAGGSRKRTSPYPVRTHASGSFLTSAGGDEVDDVDSPVGGGGGGVDSWLSNNGGGNQMLGTPSEGGHVVAIDPYNRYVYEYSIQYAARILAIDIRFVLVRCHL